MVLGSVQAVSSVLFAYLEGFYKPEELVSASRTCQRYLPHRSGISPLCLLGGLLK